MIKARGMLIAAVTLVAAYGFAAWGAEELPGLRCDMNVTSEATGFFRVEQDANGVWRFVTPGGHGFFLAANNGPSRMGGDACPALGYSPYTRTLEAKYGKDRDRWACGRAGDTARQGLRARRSE